MKHYFAYDLLKEKKKQKEERQDQIRYNLISVGFRTFIFAYIIVNAITKCVYNNFLTFENFTQYFSRRPR